jgi:oligogalacturonide lyase
MPIRQITDHPSIHHHPFFLVPPFDQAMHHLAFVSHRTGRPEIFLEKRSAGELVQVTDRDDLHEWSLFPSRDGKWVYFTAGSAGWRADTGTLKEERILDFSDGKAREDGFTADAMGTTALSFDDRYWAVRSSHEGKARIHVLDTETLESRVILTRDVVSHMMFCPDDSSLLLYGGPLTDRIRCIRRDGSENRRLFQRTDPGQWITHESWIPGTGEVQFVDWPHGTKAVDPRTGKVRTITAINAWHAISNPQGTLVVADTNFPDRGIVLFDPREECGPVRTLCFPKSSNAGEHWGGPFPYNDGPKKFHAPQHTHPHPVFSPDGEKIVYTSDISGFPQLYEVSIL